MQTLQMLQQLEPAAVTGAFLALPWIAVTLMHLAGAASQSRLDDKWNSRAGAAVRWAGAAAGPAQGNAVLEFAARRSVRSNAQRNIAAAESLPHAA